MDRFCPPKYLCASKMHQRIIHRIGVSILLCLPCYYACERNHPPELLEITCLPESRSAGTTFALRASASDLDGDKLNYLWYADGGAFMDSANSDQTNWKSPVDGNGKIFCITLTVSDGEEEIQRNYAITLTDPVYGDIAGFVYYAKCKVPVREYKHQDVCR